MINFLYLTISIISLIVAITIHEFSHALVADKLGDPTPRSQGRLSLNPLKHLDPLGTLMLILIHFGWGKPVPIDPYNLRHPKRDELLIALAGPASNLLLALIITLLAKFLSFDPIAVIFFSSLIQINVVLAIFNLIPIPPLDGSQILLNLLPQDTSLEWQDSLRRYGPILLLILLFLPFSGSNLVSIVITPIISSILKLLGSI